MVPTERTLEPTAQLRAVGLRVTGPRVAVLTALREQPHARADAVIATARRAALLRTDRRRAPAGGVPPRSSGSM